MNATKKVSVSSMNREECIQELKEIAKRNPQAPSSRGAKRGITSRKKLNNYESALNQDREAGLITAKDHGRAAKIVDRIRYLSQISTSAAAERLGLTPDQFRRLAQRAKLERVGQYKNPHYKSG